MMYLLMSIYKQSHIQFFTVMDSILFKHLSIYNDGCFELKRERPN